MTTNNLLSLLIWLPIVAGFAVLLIGDGGDRASSRASAMRWFSLIASLVIAVFSLPLLLEFDRATAAMQFIEQRPWVPRFNAEYYLGVDGLSAPLILLTTFITPLVLISAWEVIETRSAQYFAAFLILEGLMIGVFCALDAMLFYIFWEAMLVPMFLIIGIWGGKRRIYATIKFFLYTFLGSVFMLVSLIYLYTRTGSYDLLEFHKAPIGETAQTLIFLSFLAAFAVKVPMWPVHTWLPDAHVEAPTGGSVVLAAIMLKMGGYGFVRLSLPIAPDASASLAWLLIAISLVAVVYIGLVALVQSDMKKLIAYSSIAHMGFVTLGFFLFWSILSNTGSPDGAALGITGAMVQMISHGLISGAMFLCVGVMYDRMHSRNIADYGGVVNTMPWFGAFMVLFAMANAGLPGTSGFVGEFMVILASFKANFWVALLAATTLILGASYTLWMVKRVLFGEVANDNVAALKDLNGREFLMLTVLAIGVLVLGVWPEPLVQMMQPSVDALVDHIGRSKL
ncbi:MAG: NADH-quinone oxidoreductase subunit M [Pseudomonadota bacterium]